MEQATIEAFTKAARQVKKPNTIYLSEKEVKALANAAKKFNVSKSTVVSLLIDLYISDKPEMTQDTQTNA